MASMNLNNAWFSYHLFSRQFLSFNALNENKQEARFLVDLNDALKRFLSFDVKWCFTEIFGVWQYLNDNSWRLKASVLNDQQLISL